MYPEDVPTALTIKEADELEKLAKGKVVLELGALMGYSTIVMGSVAIKVYSVDPHEGYPTEKSPSTLKPFLENLKFHAVERVVVPMISDFRDGLWIFPENSFEMAFIDLTGQYDLTLEALLTISPLIKVNGWIAVHDCGRKEPDCGGATKATEKFIKDKHWGLGSYMVDTLMVFQRRANIYDLTN